MNICDLPVYIYINLHIPFSKYEPMGQRPRQEWLHVICLQQLLQCHIQGAFTGVVYARYSLESTMICFHITMLYELLKSTYRWRSIVTELFPASISQLIVVYDT